MKEKGGVREKGREGMKKTVKEIREREDSRERYKEKKNEEEENEKKKRCEEKL